MQFEAFRLYAHRRIYRGSCAADYRDRTIAIMPLFKLTKESEAEIDAILDYEGEDQHFPQMVAKKDRICDILKVSDCSYTADIYPKFVGIDPSNRNEDLMTADGVVERGIKITKAGWSWKAVEHEAICMEDDPQEKMVAKHTVQMTSLSPNLANMKMDEIQVGSLGTGHTNQWLCCVLDEVPLEGYTEITVNGRISKTKVFAKDQNMGNACTTGIHWTVIRHPVRKRFPKLAGFIQSALNIKNHIAKGDR